MKQYTTTTRKITGRSIHCAQFFLISACIFLQSCFYKSDKKGTADQVYWSEVISTGNGEYLFTKEEIFHATSKSSGGGMTRISGWASYRYTIYDPASGEIVSRWVAGDAIDKACNFLGYAGNKLWFYSIKKKFGLHARDPKSLDVVVSEKDILEGNPEIGNSLAQPVFNEIWKYFGMDELEGKVILGNLEGEMFLLDPETLKAEKTTEQPTPVSSQDALQQELHLSANRKVRMNQDSRNKIEWYSSDQPLDCDLSFLEGEFITETGTSRRTQIIKGYYDDMMQSRSEVEGQMNEMKTQYPYVDASYSDIPRELWNDYSDRQTEYRNLQYKLEEYDRYSENFDTYSPVSEDYLSVFPDSSHILVMHSANTTDTASMLLSYIELDAANHCNLLWVTHVPGIFHDPSKAIKTNSFKTVFSKGNPHFDYEWFGVSGNVLVGIRMLHVFGIELTTGKVLYLRRL